MDHIFEIWKLGGDPYISDFYLNILDYMNKYNPSEMILKTVILSILDKTTNKALVEDCL